MIPGPEYFSVEMAVFNLGYTLNYYNYGFKRTIVYIGDDYEWDKSTYIKASKLMKALYL